MRGCSSECGERWLEEQWRRWLDLSSHQRAHSASVEVSARALSSELTACSVDCVQPLRTIALNGATSCSGCSRILRQRSIQCR